MKSFTLISGILIILLGVFFFANPTSLLAIVGWIFALMMLISGVQVSWFISNVITRTVPSSNYFKASFRLFWYYFAIGIGMGTLRCRCDHHRLVAPCLSLYPRLPSLSPTSVWFFQGNLLCQSP